MRSPSVTYTLRKVSAAIDKVRVELHGHYDYSRLREFVAYEQHTESRLRGILVALATPVPCYLVLVAVDSIPLAPIDDGLTGQPFGFWFRSAFSGSSMAFFAIALTAQSVPALPMSSMRLCCISLFIGVALLPVTYLLARLIGFPTPFGVQVQTTPWTMLVLGSLYASWKDTLRTNQEARETLKQLLVGSGALFTLVIVYTALSCIFNQLSYTHQNILSCFLPLVKIAFKNWGEHGLPHAPHLKPVMSVFNVDLFHAMFVASAMQKTASGSALVILLGVDILQNIIAVYEVRCVAHSVHQSKVASRHLSRTGSTLQRRKAQLAMNLAPLSYALHVLENSSSVRRTLGIEVRPRREAEPIATQGSAWSGGGTDDSTAIFIEPLQPNHTPAKIVPTQGPNVEVATISTDGDSELAAAKAMLRILYMTEFYILTEYIEVIVAVTYGAYLYTLSYLPSRIYYTQLAMLSANELRTKALHVLAYAGLEVLSFVVFCVAVNRVMERFSLVEQLGFVLEKHWRAVQTSFVVWMLFVVQTTLQHFGTDYTFEFKWLKNQ